MGYLMLKNFRNIVKGSSAFAFATSCAISTNFAYGQAPSLDTTTAEFDAISQQLEICLAEFVGADSEDSFLFSQEYNAQGLQERRLRLLEPRPLDQAGRRVFRHASELVEGCSPLPSHSNGYSATIQYVSGTWEVLQISDIRNDEPRTEDINIRADSSIQSAQPASIPPRPMESEEISSPTQPQDNEVRNDPEECVGVADDNERLACYEAAISGEVDVRAPERQEPALEGEALVSALQTELTRLGCNPRGIDGKWGRNSQRALDRFAEFSNYEGDPLEVSMSTLGLLRPQDGTVCPLDCRPTEQIIDGACVTKTCPSGQRLNSSGQCYTPEAAAPPTQQPRSPGVRVCFTFNGVTRCN